MDTLPVVAVLLDDEQTAMDAQQKEMALLTSRLERSQSTVETLQGTIKKKDAEIENLKMGVIVACMCSIA
ncbi:hypothetical protein M885DRAFT_614225 [Pelagophyceae sp. CCMP2097]|nr:hypothetical protein M885DRAFT_614225 [Pelagophyceae sp. CCMP2097]